MPSSPLPHRYPFELVDVAADGRARFRISASGRLSRGGELPAVLGIEILAQAAAASHRNDDPASQETRQGAALVALQDVEILPALHHAPLRAGDTVEAEVEDQGGVGALRRFGGRLLRDGEVVLMAGFTVAG